MNITESVDRVLRQEETMADLFYLIFLDRSPEVRHHFEDVDLDRQAVLLTMALLAIERNYAGRYPATANYLRLLGKQHQELGIAPELYPAFRNALLATLERFHGDDWGPELARQWREAIDRAVAIMLEAYPSCPGNG